jgi:hypothetical protein
MEFTFNLQPIVRTWDDNVIENLRDLIDSGVAYWAEDRTEDEHKLPVLFVLTETEDDPPKTFTVDLALLELGVNRILSGSVPVNSGTLGNIAAFIVNNDIDMIDSEDVDLIVQAGCFNDIKYG